MRGRRILPRAPLDMQAVTTGAAIAAFGIVAAAMVAGLLSLGYWYVALALIVAPAAFYLLNKYPFSALMVWLTLTPFLMVGSGGRPVYWLIHRALPVATLVVIVISRWIGVRTLKFPKLGWPEAMMAGYVVLTITSVAFRSLDQAATYIYMYDHVVIPMSLYLLVRLLAPDEEDLRRLVPVLVFFLATQALVGIVGWVAPGALPAGWLSREERATGTLRHPNVYSVSLIFAALYVTHYAQTLRGRPWVARTLSLTLPVALGMAVATLSRASWLAAAAVLAGLWLVYPRVWQRIVQTLVVVAVLAVVVGGAFTSTRQVLQDRFYSEQSAQSALSRLPVILASFRMIEARPLIGWGYENFDRYDQMFQGSIEGLYVPEKDHASHNLFLTLGAESGLIGLGLYLGPAVWWLRRSRLGMRNLPEAGFRSRKLVPMLWLAMLAQVVAFNFSNNRVAFGLAVWWLALGLIATACDFRDRATQAAEADLKARISALAEPDPLGT